ncbi:MAG: UDP-N-acetylmuramoyl-tripeptide--D-alanyl-D-alanine ligase [Bacteroidetes bacterium]|nr:UDP-N-acetylmuramoyl-tripeptide--D-alanyl-D-alanine ligase [Bacteroidota bacterium]
MTIEKLYEKFLDHPEVSTDSRNIPEGVIFFGLKGETFDGNEYAAMALEKGASYAVVDDKKFAAGSRCILVEDSLKTLQELAKYHRKQFDIPVIAITGTNGKTTTKELIAAVLSRKYRTLATSGNLNNHIGVPLTLLKLKKDTEIAIVEMGANHQGEIDFLCRIAEPAHGIITNIGKAHLEGFGGFEGVIQTKTELFRYLKSMNGSAFVNTGDPLLVEHSAGMQVIPYGNGQPAEILELSSDPFVSLKIKLEKDMINVSTKLFGNYNADNVLAAACIGHYFGVAGSDIKDAIESYEPANNRSQLRKTESNVLILDMYNANPTSMEQALNHFSTYNSENKVLILGDMLELGSESDKEHLQVLALIDKLGFTDVYLVGPVFTRLNSKREWLCFQDSDLARMWLEHHKLQNSTVLIKGSRGIKLEKVVEML